MNRLLLLLTLVGLLSASGAACPRMRHQLTDPAPIVFQQPPTLEELVRVVNANSAPVRQLQSEGVSLKVAGYPPLRADLWLERPNRFRLRGQLMGLPELDLGSNDELFWVWVKHSRPEGVYYLRHEQLAQLAASQQLVIDPHWLIDALGLVYFNPADHHEGPYSDAAGRLQIISHIRTPAGVVRKATVIHNTYGWLLEQHIYDAQGQLLASTAASDHRYYPLEGLSLPHRIDVQLFPPGGFEQGQAMQFRLELSRYEINRLSADPGQLWAMPQYEGYPPVDLAQLQQPAGPPNGPYPVPRQTTLGQPHVGYRPRYRGDSLGVR